MTIPTILIESKGKQILIRLSPLGVWQWAPQPPVGWPVQWRTSLPTDRSELTALVSQVRGEVAKLAALLEIVPQGGA